MPPRAKRDEFLRHEKRDTDDEVYVNFHDVDEDGIVTRESGVVEAEKPRRGRGKRSVEDMMASMPNELAQSTYALERIAAIEDQIVRVLSLCSPEALELVLKQRPSLRRYKPED
jgi:hypothetical protein